MRRCHVMTLRSCDFFGRVVINSQEVMMVALNPEERITHTHTHKHTDILRAAQRDRPHVVMQ